MCQSYHLGPVRAYNDTVLIEGLDEVELYTGFEHPGLWMAHCHSLSHAELGMMTLINVRR
jgi:FtsP/CotA-like multicopper oxidase with cupredoxin domain